MGRLGWVGWVSGVWVQRFWVDGLLVTGAMDKCSMEIWTMGKWAMCCRLRFSGLWVSGLRVVSESMCVGIMR